MAFQAFPTPPCTSGWPTSRLRIALRPPVSSMILHAHRPANRSSWLDDCLAGWGSIPWTDTSSCPIVNSTSGWNVSTVVVSDCRGSCKHAVLYINSCVRRRSSGPARPWCKNSRGRLSLRQAVGYRGRRHRSLIAVLGSSPLDEVFCAYVWCGTALTRSAFSPGSACAAL